LKLHRGVAQRGIVVLLIACLLRALVPVDELAASAQLVATAELAARDYPCAGHACACGDRDHCLAACCCFPHEHPSAAAARLDAHRSAHLSAPVENVRREARTTLVRARRCDGGAQRPTASAPTIVSVEPNRVEWPAPFGDAPLRASVCDDALEHIRPDPPTPPPRAFASAV
jgi:hypothetical protein